MTREILHVDWAVVVNGEVHWFDSYISATYFAADNKTDVIENIEYYDGGKLRINLTTNERKEF